MRLKKMLAQILLSFLVVTAVVPSAINLSVSAAGKEVSQAGNVIISGKDDQIKKIRAAMLQRKPEIVLEYNGSLNDLVNDVAGLMNKVFAINDLSTSTDSDYLQNIYDGCEVSTEYTSTHCVLSYQFTYRETKEETDKVDAKIKAVLKKMKISSKTTYQKIKLIHDYIVNQTQYDTNYENYTAYNALFDKSSVCQGYALLTYKMMTAAGVPCRIITGMSGEDGQAYHAWNIVKLNGAWYNIDTTWDDPITSTGEAVLTYNYFLKSNADFKQHWRDAEFKTKEFNKKYPMALESRKLTK